MNLQERFAELREEERGTIPPFVAPASRRPVWRRPAAAIAFLLLIIIVAARRHNAPFTPADRAAAHAMAAWHPPTDFLLRMPSTGVSR